MRRPLPLLAVCAALAVAGALWTSQDAPPTRHGAGPGATPDVAVPDRSEAVLADAFAERRRSLQVEGRGQVSRLLADDNDGSRHQRFVLRLASGQTLLVAHNIDLAERVAGLEVGDTVAFFGEYEWSDRGGVIHWTHHDPDGSHVAGWLRHEGVTYR